MDANLAYLLADIADEWGAEVMDDYSGRGMYGDTTHAVTMEASGTELAMNILERVQDGLLTEDDLEGIKIGRWRTDSMGMGTVIY